jgi:hypothetical protein
MSVLIHEQGDAASGAILMSSRFGQTPQALRTRCATGLVRDPDRILNVHNPVRNHTGMSVFTGLS